MKIPPWTREEFMDRYADPDKNTPEGFWESVYDLYQAGVAHGYVAGLTPGLSHKAAQVAAKYLEAEQELAAKENGDNVVPFTKH